MLVSESIPAQRFGPTSGLITGTLGLLGCAVAMVAVLVDDVSTGSIRVALGIGTVGVLVWAYLLRPRIIVESGGTLLLRNAFADWRVPLAGIKVVGVRAVTTVKTADGGRYEGVAVGRKIRSMVRGDRPSPGGGFLRLGGVLGPGAAPVPEPPAPRPTRPTERALPDFVTEQVLNAAGRARDLGIPDGPAQRLYAVPELVAFGLFLAAFAVSFAF